MGLEYGTFAIGGSVFPLVSSTGNSALQDADPALFEALSFWQAMLAIHLGDRWNSAASAVGRDDLAGIIVASTAPYDPVPVFQDAQFKLPLLAAYRMSSTFVERTASRIAEVGTWGVDWVLPPLTAGQLEALYPFLGAAGKVFADRTDAGWDPAYASGRKVWTVAGLESIRIASSKVTWLQNRGPSAHGQASQTNTPFPCLHLEVEVKERQNDVAGAFSPMQGADVSVTVAGRTGGIAQQRLVRINHASPTTVLGNGDVAMVDVSGGAPLAIYAPAAPNDGTLFSVVDVTGGFLVTPCTITASAGQAIEDPAAPGTFGASCALTVAGAAVDWIFDALHSRWKVFDQTDPNATNNPDVAVDVPLIDLAIDTTA